MKQNVAVALIACAFSGAVFAQASSTIAPAPLSPSVTVAAPAPEASAAPVKHHRRKHHHHRKHHTSVAAPAMAASQ